MAQGPRVQPSPSGLSALEGVCLGSIWAERNGVDPPTLFVIEAIGDLRPRLHFLESVSGNAHRSLRGQTIAYERTYERPYFEAQVRSGRLEPLASFKSIGEATARARELIEGKLIPAQGLLPDLQQTASGQRGRGLVGRYPILLPDHPGKLLY